MFLNSHLCQFIYRAISWSYCPKGAEEIALQCSDVACRFCKLTVPFSKNIALIAGIHNGCDMADKILTRTCLQH